MRGYRRLPIALGLCLVCLAGAMAVAQEKTIEIKNGVVLDVEGNVVLVRTYEGVREVVIPEDFRFDLNGKTAGVRDLKRGMTFTTFITTTETPLEMTTTEVKSAEVLHVSGNTVMVKMSNGEIKKFWPKDMRTRDVMFHDGQGLPVELHTLRPGDVVNATIVTKHPPQTLTDKEYAVYLDNPQPKPTPVVAQARPAKPLPVVLPKTGSSLPLLGLVGVSLLVLAGGATLLRRFVTVDR